MVLFIIFAVIFQVYELPQIKKRLIKGLGADNFTLNKTFALVVISLNILLSW
jgi:hypothetical protein